MRRREFLIAGSLGAAFGATVARGTTLATGSGMAVVRGSTLAGASETASPADIHALVYEPRCTVARDIAERHARRGVQVFSTDECMVRLWRGPLAQQGRGGSIRIAGTTLYSDFAIARDCARERGLTVMSEGWLKGAPFTLVKWLIGSS